MAKRLARDERRAQLLAMAKTIVREEGVDALTLGHLAARSDVSKPIAYDHFGTREALLIELYREIDDAHARALRQALSERSSSFEETARAIGACYMNCSLALGGEWHAIAAALQGNEAMDRVLRELQDGYVGLYAAALERFTTVRGEELRLRCVGIHGAAESIAREMALGRANPPLASATLQTLILAALK